MLCGETRKFVSDSVVSDRYSTLKERNKSSFIEYKCWLSGNKAWLKHCIENTTLISLRKSYLLWWSVNRHRKLLKDPRSVFTRFPVGIQQAPSADLNVCVTVGNQCDLLCCKTARVAPDYQRNCAAPSWNPGRGGCELWNCGFVIRKNSFTIVWENFALSVIWCIKKF